MYKVVVNGTTYTPANEESPIKIVILQRGWCMVGRFERDGSDCKLRDAAVIRQWEQQEAWAKSPRVAPLI